MYVNNKDLKRPHVDVNKCFCCGMLLINCKMRHLKRNLKTIVVVTAMFLLIAQGLVTLFRGPTIRKDTTNAHTGIRESPTDDLLLDEFRYDVTAYDAGAHENEDEENNEEPDDDDHQKMRWHEHYKALDNGDMKSSRRKSGAVHVLVSSYMRSGSTFTTSLLSGPGVFLVNEPLQLLTSWGYLTGNSTWCSQRNTQCRTARTACLIAAFYGWITDLGRAQMTDFDENGVSEPCNMSTNLSKVDPELVPARSFAQQEEHPVSTAIRVLQSIYSCQFESGFHSLIADPEKMSAGDAEPTWGDYRACQGTHYSSEVRKACLPYLGKTCQQAHTRLTKVIRLSVDTYDQLLQEDPSLRVMHMFRDPVNIIASRLTKSKWYSIGPNSPYSISENSQSLCDKMLADYHAGVKLSTKYPDRFVMLRYEDFRIADSLELSKKVLNFMQLPNNTDLSHIEIINDAFRVYRKEQITVKILSEIYSVCVEVISNLGY